MTYQPLMQRVKRRIKQGLSLFVATTHILLGSLAVLPNLASAQTTDVDPPVVELEVVTEGVQGETQVFSATVNDNTSVLSVILHYRFNDSSNFESVPMTAIQGTDIYTASVDTTGVSAGVIQYYLEAKDAGNNRTVEGFAFDPFERVLVEQSIVTAEAAPADVPVANQPMSFQRKLAYGLLGLLVVGGLASAAGGSSGGSGDSGEVDVNILVDRFQ